MPSQLGKPNNPRRGQGTQTPAPMSLPAPPVQQEKQPLDAELMVCVDRYVDDNLLALSSDLALAETADNLPLVPVTREEISPATMAILIGKQWQVGKNLLCAFMDGDQPIHERIIRWAKEWEKYANIKFDFISDASKADIRIAFEKTGSWSYIGTDCLTVAKDACTMNFGWLTTTTAEEEVCRVVMHEFGHALGCIHEHQHPQVGIPWNKEAVYAYYAGPPNKWSRAEVDRNLFKAYAKTRTQFSEWDSKSIMAYAVPKSLTDGVFEIGWNKYPSETDIQFVGKLYPLDKPDNEIPYIKKLYKVATGFEISDIEQERYVKMLRSKGRAVVIQEMERSTPAVHRMMTVFYSLCLNRKPKTEEILRALQKLKQQVTEEQILAEIVAGEEFYMLQRNNSLDVIKRIYQVLINRQPLELELAQHNLNLSLFGRYHVALGICNGADHRGKVIESYYRNLLDRPPSVGELNAWLTSNVDLAKIRFAIEVGQEFYNK